MILTFDFTARKKLKPFLKNKRGSQSCCRGSMCGCCVENDTDEISLFFQDNLCVGPEPPAPGERHFHPPHRRHPLQCQRLCSIFDAAARHSIFNNIPLSPSPFKHPWPRRARLWQARLWQRRKSPLRRLLLLPLQPKKSRLLQCPPLPSPSRPLRRPRLPIGPQRSPLS